jgi:uncharacterized membrane protein YhaH (DUF805 family)
MLGSAFSFRGRIGRLQYFLGGLGVFAAFVLPMIAIMAATGVRDPASAGPALIFIALFALVGLPLFFWASLALQARRIRDIGLEPLYVMPAMFMFTLVDFAVAVSAPGLAIPGQHQTFVGVTVSGLMGLALLFWPGKSDRGGPRMLNWMSPGGSSDDGPRAPEHDLDLEPAAYVPVPVAPVRRPPFRVANAAGVTFGRRGL